MASRVAPIADAATRMIRESLTTFSDNDLSLFKKHVNNLRTNNCPWNEYMLKPLLLELIRSDEIRRKKAIAKD